MPLRAGLIAVGEVGLTGQLRPSTGLDRRLAEARRLGFTHAVVPESARGSLRVPEGMTVLPAPDVATAASLARDPTAEFLKGEIDRARTDRSSPSVTSLP